MRWREIGWAAFLAGLPLSPLLLGPLTGHAIDLWHAHAWWAYLWLVILTALTIGDGVSSRAPNRPLAWWTGWVGGWWLVSFLIALKQRGGYDLSLMLGVLHLATALVMYHLVVQLRSDAIWRILPWVARTGVVLSAYGLLQYFGFEQFFTDLILQAKNRRVLGTIGNPSHFAAYLSCVLPLTLVQRGVRWKVGSGLILLAILASRSLGGMIAAGIVLAWWLRRIAPRWMMPFLVVVAGIAVWQYLKDQAGLQHGAGTPIMSDSGRLVRWGLLLDAFRNKLLTGAGPGALLQFSQSVPNDPNHPLYHWRHAHNEYLQILLEQGVIGLALVGWMVWDWARKFWMMRRSPVVAMLGAVFVAFLCNAAYNFPAHLWVMSSLGLFAYAGLYACWAERVA